ncbi:hypothetical protein [Pedobacter sp. Leaf250]|uniref:hypothetical protein n=1 Tax=Pedobacter sp. Leaf250 TaxID=2876559 RepID=UPI001E377128|nr:hypothetical protein [Pedobacter sp. Leaf250]
MRKTILSIAAVGIFAATLVSCDNTKTKTTTSSDTTVVSGDTTVKTTSKTEEVKSDVPTFSSDEVNKGLAEYAKLKDEYIAALKSKNQTEIQALSTKYSTWAQTASTWASKLKPDEVQKYSDYMTKLSQEWSAAAQEAVK